MRHAERLVGKIGTRAERAIDRLAELSEHRELTNVSLAATRAVLDQWVRLTEQFVQARQFQELTVQCEEIKENQAAQKKRGVGWAFKPKAD